MDTTCRHCGLGGEFCLLRFSKSPRPHYSYEKRQMGEGLADVCVGIDPAPRKIANPAKESCPEWRDVAGRDKEAVQKLLRDGTYKY